MNNKKQNNKKQHNKKQNDAISPRVPHELSELELLNKELKSFCYSISHDLRAPLRRATSFCQAAKEDIRDNSFERALKYIEKAQDTMAEMNKLIDDLLRLSVIQQQPLEKNNFNISSMAEKICKQLNQFGEKTIRYIIHPNMTHSGDISLIKILLENIFDNAWKYSQNRSDSYVEFGVNINNSIKIFFVQDNGVGFDMRYAYKLFSPFQRLHSKNDYTGTGIGLATAKKIVQRHNGKIWAKGFVNEGASFYFTLGK